MKRNRKGEFFVFIPRSDRGWNPHTSYHLDGTLHMKSYDRVLLTAEQRQPLTGKFQGNEHLGVSYGYAPKGVGAICDPAAFAGVVEVAPDILGPRHGGITVDLVEPEKEPDGFPWARIVTREVFRDFEPWVIITVGMQGS